MLELVLDDKTLDAMLRGKIYTGILSKIEATVRSVWYFYLDPVSLYFPGGRLECR